MAIRAIWAAVVKIWKDSVLANVFATAIVAVLGASAWHWWEQILVALPRFWAYLTGNAVITRWVLWLLFLCAFALVGLAIAAALSTVRQKLYGWEGYNEDEFFFMQWRWGFFDGAHPYNLSAFCCACDFQLDVEGDQYAPVTIYKCPCGQTNMPFNETRERVELRVKKMIQQKIRTGAWQQAIRRSQ